MALMIKDSRFQRQGGRDRRLKRWLRSELYPIEPEIPYDNDYGSENWSRFWRSLGMIRERLDKIINNKSWW